MPKIKKYVIYLVSFLSLIILATGTLFTVIQIQSQKQNNQFCDKIEEINILIKNGDISKARLKLLETQNVLKPLFWNKKSISNKKALLSLLSRKTGELISKEGIKDYISKAENYKEFNLVKECLIRILFLEKRSYDEMQKFRWKHGMQRMHLLSTLRADLRYKNILPKQVFDFYLKNLHYFSANPDFEAIFIIMAAS